MSDTDYTSLDPSDPGLPGKLRDIIDALTAEKKNLLAENAALKAEKRTTTLGQKIAERGLNPKIADFVPADITDDGLDDWLGQYGEVFGVGQPAAQQQEADPAFVGEARRQAEALQGASQGTPGDPLARIASAQNWDELQAVLKSL